MNAPPEWAIAAAVEAARKSPCAKSKRGVCIYRHDAPPAHRIVSGGFNGQPGGGCAATHVEHILAGSAVVGITNRRQPTEAEHAAARHCRDNCGKLCNHAEQRAIRSAAAALGRSRIWPYLDAVHVKIGDDGQLVAGGGPSCWQCSREVADVMLGGFWLFEVYQPDPPCPSDRCPLCTGEACAKCHPGPGRPHCDHDVMERHESDPAPPAAVWRRYTADEFHRATLKACGLAAP